MPEQNLSHRDHIPEGWRPLFDELMTNLGALDDDFRIVQAKEKFGELRVYLKSYAPGARDLIDAATRESKKTCQVCGAEAMLRVTRDLYQTLCEDHQGVSTPAQKSPLVGRFRLSLLDGLKDVDASPQTNGENG
jgi:hypothetical protein